MILLAVYPLVAAWLLGETLVTWTRHATAPAADAADRYSSKMVAGGIVSGLVLAEGLRRAPGPGLVGSLTATPALARYAGLVLVIGAVALRWISMVTLRQQFTTNLVIVAGHTLVTHGVYRYVRHPSYLGGTLGFLGLGLSVGGPLGAVVVATPIGLAYRYRMRVEERMLRDAFGERYLGYARTTKRLIPGVY
ncbi:MAG: isoprenylcysteine carboxylmethyltransferase family protein [Dactylosporangium sp.]|nr:isoprenylcysteine carboxylmethyltransferase family protein [Dactylosporangium sp.]NNJ59371.1 isoprenylcysteine carboxylmethyltransferase family protein [Dactylosporangium sp.]